MNTIVGNDISEFQGQVDFDTYKSNSNFVMIKASEGVGFTDPQFLRNQAESRRVELSRGYYHFARADLGNTPQAEADYFLQTIGQLQNGEVVALDFECSYTGNIVQWCKGFLDEVYAKTSIKPLIYLNQSLAANNDFTDVVNAGYGLWLASYTGNPGENTGNTGKWQFMAMQQWTDGETVPGIKGAVDGDVFFGDIATFQKYGYTAKPQGTFVEAATFTQLVTKASSYDEFVKIGYNNADEVTTKVAALQATIDTQNTEIGSLTKANDALVLEVKQAKDDLAAQLDFSKEQAKKDSTAIDTGIQAQADLKELQSDVQTIGAALGLTHPTIKDILFQITFLQSQVTKQQVVTKKQAQTFEQFFQSFLNIFLKGKEQ